MDSPRSWIEQQFDLMLPDSILLSYESGRTPRTTEMVQEDTGAIASVGCDQPSFFVEEMIQQGLSDSDVAGGQPPESLLQRIRDFVLPNGPKKLTLDRLGC